MRIIRGTPVVLFFLLVIIGLLFSSLLIYFVHLAWSPWTVSEVLAIGLWSLLSLVFVLLSYRLFFCLFPLPQGEILEGTWEESLTMIYQLFSIMLWRPIFQTRLIPVPMSRLVYIALGSKVGAGTYFPGTIGDPPLFSVGRNCIIGEDSLVISHAIEGARLAFYPVRLGDHVTIGAKSIVMAGVEIEDGAIVAAGSIVTKMTKIHRDEIWAGVPAKKIGLNQKKA
ncbi:MAG: hypothetical protein KDD61_00325 [Bdellovibrionales bacterium]|nr:hypothetical protein [Bdellovibrionales bacterium]